VRLVAQRHTLLKSAATEREILEVIARPYLAGLIPSQSQAWLNDLLLEAELVVIKMRVSACRDATDDKFLELAVNGHADIMISGDADLLALHPFQNIPVNAPATFIQHRFNAN